MMKGKGKSGVAEMPFQKAGSFTKGKKPAPVKKTSKGSMKSDKC